MATHEGSSSDDELYDLTKEDLHVIGHSYAVTVEETFDEFYNAYEELFKSHNLPDPRGIRTQKAVDRFEEAAVQYFEIDYSEYDEQKELAGVATMNGALTPGLLDKKMDRDEFGELVGHSP